MIADKPFHSEIFSARIKDVEIDAEINKILTYLVNSSTPAKLGVSAIIK